ncbi:MAG TPA: hypothetical protein VGD52_08935 [Pseudoduganella sp.]
METNSSSPTPGNATTFVPLPGGAPPPCLTPERIREQLGWNMLQSNWR